MSFTVIIPARFGSERLPGKPLRLIADKPMIQWVYQQAEKSQAEKVIVATDHERIKEVVEGFNGHCIMTHAHHASGTDRLQEVVKKLRFNDGQIIVNVQGDEPLIPPEIINQAADLLKHDHKAKMSTLYKDIKSIDDAFNPNVVKLVTDQEDYALYFSRAPIPWDRDQFNGSEKMLPEYINLKHHLGIYGYRVSLLNNFVKWQAHPLEKTEKLEQLRALAYGIKIKVAKALKEMPTGVDTQDDLMRMNALIKQRHEENKALH